MKGICQVVGEHMEEFAFQRGNRPARNYLTVPYNRDVAKVSGARDDKARLTLGECDIQGEDYFIVDSSLVECVAQGVNFLLVHGGWDKGDDRALAQDAVVLEYFSQGLLVFLTVVDNTTVAFYEHCAFRILVERVFHVLV